MIIHPIVLDGVLWTNCASHFSSCYLYNSAPKWWSNHQHNNTEDIFHYCLKFYRLNKPIMKIILYVGTKINIPGHGRDNTNHPPPTDPTEIIIKNHNSPSFVKLLWLQPHSFCHPTHSRTRTHKNYESASLNQTGNRKCEREAQSVTDLSSIQTEGLIESPTCLLKKRSVACWFFSEAGQISGRFTSLERSSGCHKEIPQVASPVQKCLCSWQWWIVWFLKRTVSGTGCQRVQCFRLNPN